MTRLLHHAVVLYDFQQKQDFILLPTLYKNIELLWSIRSMSSSKDAVPSALTLMDFRSERLLTNWRENIRDNCEDERE